MKNLLRITSVALLLLCTSILSITTYAQDKIVYIHGFTTSQRAAFNGAPDGTGLELCNNRRSCSYWFDQLSGDVVHVGWASSVDDWRNRPVSIMVNMLNNNCRGNSCTIICHSTGCAITGKAIADFGNRFNWRINRVLTLGSAEGGSELANFANLIGSNGRYITPSIVRGAYNHNTTRGIPFFMGAGFDGNFSSFLLPGEDDGTVAFHSACGYVRNISANRCDRNRRAGKWANHVNLSFCGSRGCDEDHTSIRSLRYQRRALANNP